MNREHSEKGRALREMYAARMAELEPVERELFVVTAPYGEWLLLMETSSAYMANWYVEGLHGTLLSKDDPIYQEFVEWSKTWGPPYHKVQVVNVPCKHYRQADLQTGWLWKKLAE